MEAVQSREILQCDMRCSRGGWVQFCQDKQVLGNKLLFSVRVDTFPLRTITPLNSHYIRLWGFISCWEVKGLGRLVKTPQVNCRHSLDVRWSMLWYVYFFYFSPTQVSTHKICGFPVVPTMEQIQMCYSVFTHHCISSHVKRLKEVCLEFWEKQVAILFS